MDVPRDDDGHLVNFKFGLGEMAFVTRSVTELPCKFNYSPMETTCESGFIRAQSNNQRMNEKQYYLEYTAADGRATEAWFYESELTSMGYPK